MRHITLQREEMIDLAKTLHKALGEAVEKGDQSVTVIVPTIGTETYLVSDAIKLAESLLDEVKAADQAAEEARRAAGYSPRFERSYMLVNEKGEPVGFDKVSYY
jgi:hypothetical protein